MKAGDKITVISVNRCVFKAIVAQIYSNGTFNWWCADIGRGEVAALYDEGVTWIYGHRNDDSKEVAALLVARALGQQGQWIRFDVNTPTVALRGRSFQLIDGHPRDMPVIPSPTDIYALEPGFEK